MKKNFRSAASAAMAFLTAATLVAGPAASAAQSYSYIRTDEISDGLEYTSEIYKGANGSGSMSYTYDFTPGGDTMPIVAYGNKLYGMSDVNDVVKYCENQGMTVMAAFNADFFNMSTGVPTGIVVREGRLCSSDGSWNAVGFRRDGTAICGAPKLDITFAVNGGQRFPIFAFNKVRDGRGTYLYSSDYSTSTHLSAEGPVVIMRKLNSDEELTINGSISLRVVEAGMSSGESQLGEDTFVLTHQKGLELGIDLTALKSGDIVTVYTGTRNESWEDVYYACGAGDMMVENSALTEAALKSTSRGPRTMLGIRNDGSVSILVCDGRDGGTADGLTLREAALRLYNDGCKNVVNLDGGGSSIASARYPGYSASSVVSNPSDGRPRKCANFILFINTGDEGEKEAYATVYPKDALVLSGGSIEMSALSYNPSYYPGREYNSGFYVSRGDGEMDGNVLTVGDGGEVYVGIKQRGLESVDAKVISVDKPETMDIVRKGSKTPITSISLQPGDKVDLDVIVTDGLRTIISEDELFDFTVDGDAGEIDKDGLFTAAGYQGAHGTITVSFGGVSRAVTVKVGEEPQILREFEAGSNYTVTAGQGTTARASVSLSGDYARYGKGSLSMTYGSAAPDTIVYTADTAIGIPSATGKVSFMAKGQGSWYIDFSIPSGIVSQAITLGGDWNFNVVDKPAGATAIAGFRAVSASDSLSGYAYIDQIVALASGANTDDIPPVIEESVGAADALNLVITDNGDYPLSKNSVEVRLDGVSTTDFTFEPSTGRFEMYLPDDGMSHKVTVTVMDHFGNLARYSTETEGQNDGPFGDLEGHWAENYVNYLYNKGVFTADTGFRPSGSATNEMIATIISRYMNIDTSLYADVQLPYADLDKVHEWALPHVKALYSLGIMQGGADSEGRVWFYPTDNSSRARVMTVLGRTLSRGYSYSAAQYADMVQTPVWAADHISLLTHLGIVNGYGGENIVAPNGTITRAEMAAILYRMY